MGLGDSPIFHSEPDSAVSLSGDLDMYELEGFEREFDTLSGDHIVIDMRAVRMISAAFIGALIRLRKRLPTSRIDVIGANRNVERTFHVVGANKLVRLY